MDVAKATRFSSINGFNDRPEIPLDNVPVVCVDDHQSDLSLRHALLIDQVLIACKHYFEGGFLGTAQEFTVSELCPPHLISEEYRMIGQSFSQPVRHVVVEEHFHAAGWFRLDAP